MIEVYYGSPSIYGRKVLTTLDEKGLDYEIKKMSFATQDHLKPEYLKLNPNGEIPTLVDDDRVIYESTAIMEYLDEEYPEPPLMPKDPYDRARVRMIDDFLDLHLHSAIRGCAIKYFHQQEITADDLKKIEEGMKRMDVYLNGQKFLVGGAFSLADCSFLPVIPSLIKFKFERFLNGSSAFLDYIERLKSRPGYKGASLI